MCTIYLVQTNTQLDTCNNVNLRAEAGDIPYCVNDGEPSPGV